MADILPPSPPPLLLIEPPPAGLYTKTSFTLWSQIQSGASSRAKHGGAYFSAVRGSIEDPIAVAGRHEVTGV